MTPSVVYFKEDGQVIVGELQKADTHLSYIKVIKTRILITTKVVLKR
ncbi:MAG: hypothetical protein GY795_36140 [Desulfobacterales bacterium]|nr:hypothetical protein [Desulfobacterales bacterium]